jgi:ABC-type uncharacterized transport system permease subunit
VTKFIRQQWLDFLYRHAWFTFILMGLSFLLFGFYSVNLFVLLKANVELILEYGMMAMADGAAQQLVELLFAAYLSMLFFLAFKVCERVLVTRLTRRLKSAGERAEQRQASKG